MCPAFSSPLSDERIICPIHSFEVDPNADCISCSEKYHETECPFHHPISDELFGSDEDEDEEDEL